MREETRLANGQAKVDDMIGFSFAPLPAESQISQVSAASGGFGKILSYGLAGRQIMVDEINCQLEEWPAQQ